MWSAAFYFRVTGACLSVIITVSFPTVFSVVCINVYLHGESKKFRKHGTVINTLFVVLMPNAETPFCKANDIRSHECSPVRRVPYVSRLIFKPFQVAISEGSHVAVGISSKATDGEDICLQTLFLFFPHTPCFPLNAPCFPPDPVPRDPVPRDPVPAFST